MGGEFGQWREWNHDLALDWQLLQHPQHAGLQRFVEDLNRTYRQTPALHVFDNDPRGFQWLDPHDSQQSVFSYLRRGYPTDNDVIVVCNFTPVPRQNYRVGAPHSGCWQEILNTDSNIYGGSGWGNMGGVEGTDVASHGQPCSLTVTIPPLSALFLKG
jgi:1,4-alpha-glucan branching enzyme